MKLLTLLILSSFVILSSLKQQDRGCKNAIRVNVYKNGKIIRQLTADNFVHTDLNAQPMTIQGKEVRPDKLEYELIWR